MIRGSNITDILLNGGLSSDKLALIEDDIDSHNRKSLCDYSAIAIIFFSALSIITAISDSVIAKNRPLYICGVLAFLLIFIANSILWKNSRKVLDASVHLFQTLMLGLGVMLAVKSSNDLSASYMVIMFAVPLLMITRPVQIASIIIVTDIVYITLMHRLQAPDLFSKDLVNAIVFGILSIIIGTSMIKMRIEKFYADYINRQLMMTDRLTGLLNRQAYSNLIDSYKDKRIEDDLVCVSFDLNELKAANDTKGHLAGDRLIEGAAECIRNVFSPLGSIYRTGGDEFIAVIRADGEKLETAKEAFRQELENHNRHSLITLSLSSGYASAQDSDVGSLEDLLNIADERMYEDKNAFYRQTGKDRRKH